VSTHCRNTPQVDSTLSDDTDLARKYAEAESLRRVAFVGITLSTVAVLAAILAVPTLYNHVQYVQSALHQELDFCKVNANVYTTHVLSHILQSRTGDLWQEVARTAMLHTGEIRHRRQADAAGVQASGYGPPPSTTAGYVPAPTTTKPSVPVVNVPVVSGSC
jgi:hypothetical protein